MQTNDSRAGKGEGGDLYDHALRSTDHTVLARALVLVAAVK